MDKFTSIRRSARERKENKDDNFDYQQKSGNRQNVPPSETLLINESTTKMSATSTPQRLNPARGKIPGSAKRMVSTGTLTNDNWVHSQELFSDDEDHDVPNKNSDEEVCIKDPGSHSGDAPPPSPEDQSSEEGDRAHNAEEIPRSVDEEIPRSINDTGTQDSIVIINDYGLPLSPLSQFQYPSVSQVMDNLPPTQVSPTHQIMKLQRELIQTKLLLAENKKISAEKQREIAVLAPAQTWCCFQCSQLHSIVSQLKSQLTDMQNTQEELLKRLTQMTEKTAAEQAERKKLQNELIQLRQQTTDIAEKLKQPSPPLNTPLQKWVTRPLTPSAPPKQSLLLGTSLLRNVDASKIHDWEVIAKGGAKITDLHVELNKLPEHKEYEEIVVVGGSIDAESKDTENVITDYQALIVSASLRADKTTFCSVLPRIDKDLTQKIKKLNKDLETVCKDENTGFVDMDNFFLLRNGTANEACLIQDGLHLSKYGVDKLLLGCKVALKPGVASAYTDSRYKKESNETHLLFKGHRNPLSNFFPMDNFAMNGIRFATSEAAYVYAKALHHQDIQTAEAVRKSKTGLHAKRLGDRIQTNATWQRRKIDIMDDIIRAKLRVCQLAKKALVDSGNKQIVEDTLHEFWGRGKESKGENMLGKLWMMYRKKLTTDPRPRSTPSQWASRESQPECFRCGESGHLVEQCRQPNYFACWNCGNSGHKRRNCSTINH